MYNIFKRIFDIISAILAIMILIPLFIPVMILLKLTAEGDVFYFQKRIGYKNKPFMIYKFATMMRDSVNMKGGFVTQKNDPRVTKFGNFMRKTRIETAFPHVYMFMYIHLYICMYMLYDDLYRFVLSNASTCVYSYTSPSLSLYIYNIVYMYLYMCVHIYIYIYI